jgi:hypothetical protein
MNDWLWVDGVDFTINGEEWVISIYTEKRTGALAFTRGKTAYIVISGEGGRVYFGNEVKRDPEQNFIGTYKLSYGQYSFYPFISGPFSHLADKPEELNIVKAKTLSRKYFDNTYTEGCLELAKVLITNAIINCIPLPEGELV